MADLPYLRKPLVYVIDPFEATVANTGLPGGPGGPGTDGPGTGDPSGPGEPGGPGTDGPGIGEPGGPGEPAGPGDGGYIEPGGGSGPGGYDGPGSDPGGAGLDPGGAAGSGGYGPGTGFDPGGGGADLPSDGGSGDDGDVNIAGLLIFLGLFCKAPTGVVYRSKTSIYTLCGYSEYVNPSVPPKKYLKQTLSGSAMGCSFNAADDCTGSINAAGAQEISGSYEFSPLDCSFVNTQITDILTAQAGCTHAVSTGNTGPLPMVVALSPNPPYQTVLSAPTLVRQFNNGCFVTIPGAASIKSVNKNNATGQGLTKLLTIEDTDANAIARANAAIGWDVVPATVTSEAARGAGQFSAAYVYVEIALQMTGLFAGDDYNIEITFGRRVTGSGDPFVAYLTETHQFTAAGGVELTPYIVIPVETGFDTNVLSFTVCVASL